MHIGRVSKGTKIYKGNFTVEGDQVNLFYDEPTPRKRKPKRKLKRKLKGSIVIGQVTGQIIGHQIVHGRTINVFDR
jgi:hypothetical protein